MKMIKESQLWRLYLFLNAKIDPGLDYLHRKINSDRSVKITFIQGSMSFLLFSFILKGFHKWCDFLSGHGKKSALFSSNILLKAFRTIDNYLVIVPFCYLFLDYGFRNFSALSMISNLWDELALLSFFMYFALRPLFANKEKARYNEIDHLIVLFMLLGIGLFFFVSPEMNVAIDGYRAVYQHMLWYFVLRGLIRQDNRHLVYKTIIFQGLFLGLHSLYQVLARVPMPGNWVDSTEAVTIRVFSIIGSPNILAAVFILFIPLMMALALVEEKKEFRFISALTTILMFVGLLFTYSRQAYLALIGAFGLFLIWYYPKTIKYFIVLLGLMLVTFRSVADRIFYLFTPEYFERSQVGGRVLRYQHALELFQENPLMGRGLGRFGGAVATHYNLTPFYVDSYYLKTLVEMGLTGLLYLFFLWANSLYKIIRIMESQACKKNMLLLVGIAVGIVAVILQNAVENVFEVPMMLAYFWGFVALALSYE